MAVSQASIIESLERACSNLNPDDFIFAFLDAYGFPKSTITRLRNGGDSRNVAPGDDIGLKKKLYFRAVPTGEDVAAELETLKDSDVVVRNDIRFVIVTDFQTITAYDLKAQERLDETPLGELDKRYAFFLPLAGYEKAVMYSEHPADLKASEKMGQLFDLIRERNDLTKSEDIHALNVFLTRLLFCFYAESTGIFAKDQMTSTLQACTREDGSDVDQFFTDLFTVLNLEDDAPERKRMPEHFQKFRYVNGGLFKDDEPVPEFGRKARRILLDCGALDWSEINPDIFGSMFQAVIDEEQRGNLGQHYTSVSNIMKVIQPLFLDPLYAELEKSRQSEKKLKALLLRLQNLRIFDPACGSGNFLIIAYKELRKLEMEIINALNALGKQSEMYYSGIKLTQFYGIEIDDFACEIATLSLWLAEHQMNMAFKEKFGYAEAALPLRDGGNIICRNSLRRNWEEVCPPKDEQDNAYEVYICGNPPFHGNKGRTEQHVDDMQTVLGDIKGYGRLDFVACWLFLAAIYAEKANSKCAFVVTNSICQGEQVSLIWPEIFSRKLSIAFAYTTFEWKNQAKGNAGVHVAVVGLSSDNDTKFLFTPEGKDKWRSQKCENISPYLVPGPNVIVYPSRAPLVQGLIRMENGSEYSNSEPLILSSEEREKLRGTPEEKWVKKLVGSSEFIKGTERYCLWLIEATPEDISSSDFLAKRVEQTRKIRLSKTNAGVIDSAAKPHLFKIPNHPTSGYYILVPRVSSVRRAYVPMGFLDSSVVATNKVQIVPQGGVYEFGILTSEMHMDWMRAVGGRLKSDYSYSATLVYNTFPWPDASEAKRKHIESLAEEVLLIREDYPDKSLADLYDPDKMPAPLLAAHKALDRAVEALYRDRPFRDASERLEHLFNRYEKLIAEEQAKAPAKKTRGGK
ncbi:N-6 DNA methylase [Achromobacter mucicolens]|uniref:class I SAM-dependent DNA methyltransferase n=1 Tax=Achromobacter mucicolens TaxID=1389922 RepID=UPI0020A51EEF|nr:DNA methyltransferase [Achromobacter mucicolens]MCP2518437.1 N-6 DNA methylase [Achromobacter mucicolens]